MHCNDDQLPIEGLKCVYGPEGMIRVCKKDECESDEDCAEKKRCVHTRWKGKMCHDVSTMCKSDKDCDVCEECLKTPNHHFKSCVRTGTKCKRDKDCRENQV